MCSHLEVTENSFTRQYRLGLRNSFYEPKEKREGKGAGAKNCENQRMMQKMWLLTKRNSRKREQRKTEEGNVKEIIDVISQN